MRELQWRTVTQSFFGLIEPSICFLFVAKNSLGVMLDLL
jgi:hypothetical protein